MIKNEKIVLKFIWGRAVFCDLCDTRLTRYKKVTKDEYLESQGVNLAGPHICAKCERKQIAANNATTKAAAKAAKTAEAKAAKVREDRRLRNIAYRARKRAQITAETETQGG